MPDLKLTFACRDKTTINQIPFFINSLGGDLAFTFNVTAQPSVGFKISLSTGK